MTQEVFEFVPPPPPRKPTLDERAEAFMRQCPEVYATMVRLAEDKAAGGASRISAKLLWEELRVLRLGGPDGTPYRLNNSYCSVFVRRVAREHPELAHLFEMRRRTSGGAR